MKVHCVSLARAIERRHHSLAQAHRLGLDLELFEATDARVLGEEGVRALLSPELLQRYQSLRHTWFSAGSVACADSHRRLLSLIANGDASWACVVEDDAELSPHFPRLLTSLVERLADSHLDVVLLCYQGARAEQPLMLDETSGQHLLQEYKLMELRTFRAHSTAGYLVRREAADRLARAQFPLIRYGADDWQFFVKDGYLRAMGAVYPLCCRPADFDSVIEYPIAPMARWVRGLLKSVPLGRRVLSRHRRNRFERNLNVVLC